jgi:hypothetical protein
MADVFLARIRRASVTWRSRSCARATRRHGAASWSRPRSSAICSTRASSVRSTSARRRTASRTWRSSTWLASTLSARLARGPLPWRDVVTYGIQVAGALHALHIAGIIHRDLKPDNIMLTVEADRSIAKLIDLGLASVGTPFQDTQDAHFTPDPPQRHQTQLGHPIGTPAYLPPEAGQCPAEPRLDVFSLGRDALSALHAAPPAIHRRPVDPRGMPRERRARGSIAAAPGRARVRPEASVSPPRITCAAASRRSSPRTRGRRARGTCSAAATIGSRSSASARAQSSSARRIAGSRARSRSRSYATRSRARTTRSASAAPPRCCPRCATRTSRGSYTSGSRRGADLRGHGAVPRLARDELRPSRQSPAPGRGDRGRPAARRGARGGACRRCRVPRPAPGQRVDRARGGAACVDLRLRSGAGVSRSFTRL